MPDLPLTLLSAVAIVVTATVVFVLLAQRWAGGPVAWSILPGLVRGMNVWSHGRDESEPLHLISPQAEEPGPPLDTSLLPLAPLEEQPPEPEAWVEEGVNPAILAEVEIEEVGHHRI